MPILEMSDFSGKGKAKTSYAEVVPSPKPARGNPEQEVTTLAFAATSTQRLARFIPAETRSGGQDRAKGTFVTSSRNGNMA